MRHKLYKAVSKVQESVELKGLIEFDPSYTKINLKGTKKENMPRISKRRGKKNSSIYSSSLRGISGHKICLVTAIDEYDNMVFKIAGLGPETIDKLNSFKSHFKRGSIIISDDKPCIKRFAKENKMFSDEIPSLANQKRYLTNNGNSLGSVNELHAEAKNLVRNKHGVSTRHLQGYLDWLVFKKQLRYKIDARRWKSTTYIETMFEIIPFTTAQIVKKEMPISLYEAYGEYHYGIFSLIN